MNPWTSIWFQPRQTIRQIVETNPRYLVVPLAAMLGAAGWLPVSVSIAGRLHLSIPVVMVVTAILGAAFGLVGLYIGGWLYRWVGSWFGGQATNVEVRAAVAWAKVPLFVSFAAWLLVQAFQGFSPAMEGEGEVQATAAVAISGIILGVVGFVIWIWETVLTCHTLGEVHRFSAWKGLGTLLIPQALFMIPVFVIAMMAAIAIPNVLRGRQVANESAAIGNLRAIVSSLEMYRSIKGEYPTTDRWGDLYGEAEPYAPSSFQTTGALASYPVQGHLYTYTSNGGLAYTVDATAQTFNQSSRSFFADETAIIRHCTPSQLGQRAGVEDEPIDQEARPCTSP